MLSVSLWSMKVIGVYTCSMVILHRHRSKMDRRMNTHTLRLFKNSNTNIYSTATPVRLESAYLKIIVLSNTLADNRPISSRMVASVWSSVRITANLPEGYKAQTRPPDRMLMKLFESTMWRVISPPLLSDEFVSYQTYSSRKVIQGGITPTIVQFENCCIMAEEL